MRKRHVGASEAVGNSVKKRDKCSLLFFLIVLFRLPPRRERQQQLQSLLLATTAAATSMRATPQTLPNRCKNWNVPLW